MHVYTYAVHMYSMCLHSGSYMCMYVCFRSSLGCCAWGTLLTYVTLCCSVYENPSKFSSNKWGVTANYTYSYYVALLDRPVDVCVHNYVQ